MYDLLGVKSHKTIQHLPEDMPYLIFLDKRFEFLRLTNLCIKVSTICDLHYNAQLICLFIKKCLFITNDIFVHNRCQNSNFIQSIFLLFGA